MTQTFPVLICIYPGAGRGDPGSGHQAAALWGALPGLVLGGRGAPETALPSPASPQAAEKGAWKPLEGKPAVMGWGPGAKWLFRALSGGNSQPRCSEAQHAWEEAGRALALPLGMPRPAHGVQGPAGRKPGGGRKPALALQRGKGQPAHARLAPPAQVRQLFVCSALRVTSPQQTSPPLASCLWMCPGPPPQPSS